MNNSDTGEEVPDQRLGGKSDTEHSVQLPTTEEARMLIKSATQKLLNVNQWDKWAGMASSSFRLTDSVGNPVDRLARQGDYIRIDVPGPGTKAGGGYDWVRIESVQSKEDSSDLESTIIQVRPSPSPLKNEEDTAHFFSDDATSSFIVKRESRIVTATIHGRNEVPNTETGNILDKARNVVFSIGAMTGLSKLQWGSLVKGLLDQ